MRTLLQIMAVLTALNTVWLIILLWDVFEIKVWVDRQKRQEETDNGMRGHDRRGLGRVA